MEKVLIKDVNYLKGDYATGYEKVRKSLKEGLISKNFKNDVEVDILDLFIRNQDKNKDFNEVIGGDLDNFIKEIVNVYFEETSTKTKVINAIGSGLVIFGAFFGIDSISMGKATLATLIMSIISFLVVALTTLFLYKISKKFSHKSSKYISFTVGVFMTIVSKAIYENVEFFRNAMENEINIVLTIIIILVTVSIGMVTMKKAEMQN